MEKELIELYEAARKAADAAATAVDGGAEEGRCLNALNRLKKFPVSYELLVSTEVGKRLRGLSKHNSDKIKVAASKVVEMWKDVIAKETLKNKRNGEAKNQAGSVKVEKMRSVKVETIPAGKIIQAKKTMPAGKIIQAKKTMPAGKIQGKNLTGLSNSEKVMSSLSDKTNYFVEQIKVEKMIKEEKSSFDGVIKPKQEPVGRPPRLNSIIYCKDPVRDKMREILVEALCKVSGEVDENLRDEVNACDPYQVAVSMETALFQKWGKPNGIEKVKYRSIMFNVKDPKNPDFRRKLLLGEIPPRSITELTPEDMASEARQKQNQKIKEKALRECEREKPPEPTTDAFRCSRCGKKEATYYQMQTRSADEPMTTFVTCVACRKRSRR